MPLNIFHIYLSVHPRTDDILPSFFIQSDDRVGVRDARERSENKTTETSAAPGTKKSRYNNPFSNKIGNETSSKGDSLVASTIFFTVLRFFRCFLKTCYKI